VIQPVCRHGLLIEAFAKQAFFAPDTLNFEVSRIGPSMYCRYGFAGSPWNVALRSWSCLSYSAWSNHFEPAPDSSRFWSVPVVPEPLVSVD
jgi:hypothetical protein